MLVKRNFSARSLLKFTGFHIAWLTAFNVFAVYLYDNLGYIYLGIPWLPVSLVGTAVAFYVGFKNNASYERLWEARKIWGAIVNDSRSFAVGCKHLINTKGSNENIALARKLIYRHIAWLYLLRKQLLVPTKWEHINANIFIRTMVAHRIKTFGTGLYEDELGVLSIRKALSEDELNTIEKVTNKATHILDFQSETLADFNNRDLLNNFRHMNLQSLLYKFYDHQGMCERIKGYPFPRQYASMSFFFTVIFILLLPFGLLPEFINLAGKSVWYSVPFSVLVSWVFLMMELIGDYSENPFEGMANDVPMLSICRTIEIDLRELIGDTDIPPKIEIKNDILM